MQIIERAAALAGPPFDASDVKERSHREACARRSFIADHPFLGTLLRKEERKKREERKEAIELLLQIARTRLRLCGDDASVPGFQTTESVID